MSAGLEPEVTPTHTVSNQNEIIHATCHWFQRVNGFASANPNNLLVHLHGPLSFSAVEDVVKEIIKGM